MSKAVEKRRARFSPEVLERSRLLSLKSTAAECKLVRSAEAAACMIRTGPQIAFWLDAHGAGYQWPLREEVRFVTETMPSSSAMMIDDFQIPGQPQFGYDKYRGQVCNLEFIRNSLAPRKYFLILPTYQERTSPLHGLRGVATFCLRRAGLSTSRVAEALFLL